MFMTQVSQELCFNTPVDSFAPPSPPVLGQCPLNWDGKKKFEQRPPL